MFTAFESIKNAFFSINPLNTKTDNVPSKYTEHTEEDEIIDNPEPSEKMMSSSENKSLLYDSNSYKVLNMKTHVTEEFHYLHGEHLAHSYDFCKNDKEVLKVHLCMVGMDLRCNYDDEHLPFLRFLMRYSSEMNTVEFPTCEVVCSAKMTKDGHMDTYFHNECKKLFLDFFIMEEQLKNIKIDQLFSKLYRGYIDISDDEIVVVFDITEFLQFPITRSNQPCWIVVDDFVQNNIPFSSTVVQFFEEREYMKDIRDSQNNSVSIPKSMYLYNMEEDRFMLQSEKSDWIEPRSYDATYGNFYYMKFMKSREIELQKGFDRFRKCIVFQKNYADFIQNDLSIDLHGEHIEIPLDDQFRDSIDEKNIIEDASMYELHTNTPVLDNEKDSIEDGKYDTDEIENNLPFVSLIMFISETGTASEDQVYCVKTESIFMEL